MKMVVFDPALIVRQKPMTRGLTVTHNPTMMELASGGYTIPGEEPVAPVSFTAPHPEMVATPWYPSMGTVPKHIDYYPGTMYEKVSQTARAYPDMAAFEFMGRKTTFHEMDLQIQAFARSLSSLGVMEGDRVTIALPNCPQAIYAFYGVNLAGGIANMVHPLSSEKEIEFYLNLSKSKVIITLDQFYDKVARAYPNTHLEHIVIASIADVLSGPLKLGYKLTEGRKIPKIPKDANVLLWKDFMAGGRNFAQGREVKRKGDDPAVILYSGGTTGTTKGIVLTNLNFNALAAQVYMTNPMATIGDKILAAMPIFHGFGLGVCIHTFLAIGGTCILVPRFTVKSYAKLIYKSRCNFIAGVPTLYEAMLRTNDLDGKDLSMLKGVFSGGDSLSIELKKRFDTFLHEHNASIDVREGYGTTECVTASCLTPITGAKEGSIGIPFPDTYYKVVRPGTAEVLPTGEEGEIVLAGPTVMKGYLDNPEETEKTLRVHDDGLTWVYTGDLGYMDEDGYIYFKGRIKRMIVTSGYNVYPAQIENVLDANENVQMSCVIGVPDPYRMQKVKAFVMLKPGVPANDVTREKLMEYCAKNIAKYAMPREIEFRDEFPKTLVGKVAYRMLEEEERDRVAS